MKKGKGRDLITPDVSILRVESGMFFEVDTASNSVAFAVFLTIGCALSLDSNCRAVDSAIVSVVSPRSLRQTMVPPSSVYQAQVDVQGRGFFAKSNSETAILVRLVFPSLTPSVCVLKCVTKRGEMEIGTMSFVRNVLLSDVLTSLNLGPCFLLSLRNNMCSLSQGPWGGSPALIHPSSRPSRKFYLVDSIVSQKISTYLPSRDR